MGIELPEAELFHGIMTKEVRILATLARGIRSLYQTRDLEPYELHVISKLLLGLKRLPWITANLNVELALKMPEDGFGFWGISLLFSEEEIMLSRFGWERSPNGPNSWEHPAYWVGANGYREIDYELCLWEPLYEWIQTFAEFSIDPDVQFDISDLSDDDIDWRDEPPEIEWPAHGGFFTLPDGEELDEGEGDDLFDELDVDDDNEEEDSDQLSLF